MAIVRLLGEQVNLQLQVCESTARHLGEVLEARDSQDREWSELPEDAEITAHRDRARRLVVGRTGHDWRILILEKIAGITADISDQGTRDALIGVAATALAALRAS